jgi:signal transduction histidine kinase
MTMTHRGDTDPMMVRVFWLLRITAFVVLAILALISPPDSATKQVTQIACFSAVGLALLAWFGTELRPRYRARVLPVALGVIAIAGGVASVTGGSGQSLVAFAAGAAFWAGSETDLPATVEVAAAGIVSIWVAGGIAGSTFGTMAGDPLLIAVGAMFGLQRHSSRVQTEQAATLLAQRERLEAEQRRADVLDERTRIAREIHDVLAHSLGALGIQIQAAKAILTDHGDTGRAVEALTTAQRMAAEGLTETRRAVHALRVDTLPLGQELAALADTHRQLYHVPVSFETSGVAPTLRPDATLALLRTAQEAMVNAAKHAPGQRVAVRLDYGGQNARLSVINGLDPAGPAARNAAGPVARRPGSTGGYGLTGMRERLRLLDGTLLAGPGENEWAVTAELPLTAAAVELAAAEDGMAR